MTTGFHKIAARGVEAIKAALSETTEEQTKKSFGKNKYVHLLQFLS